MVEFNSIELTETIELTGSFLGGEQVLLLPTSLDTSILPLEVDEFVYSERNVTENGKAFLETTHNLVKPRSDLYSFGIWGRKIVLGYSSGSFTAIGSFFLMFLVALCTMVMHSFNLIVYV